MAEGSRQSKFEATKLAIDHYNGTESSFDVFLGDWPDEDRSAFFKRYIPYTIEKHDKDIDRQQAKQPLDRKGYIAAANKLNFRLPPIEKFVSVQLLHGYADPRLGTSSGASYDHVMQVKPTKSNAPPPIQYILPLGALEVVPKDFFGKVGRGDYTPFRVCMNPVDKSIWLVMRPYLIDGIGERDPIPSSSNTWNFLGEQFIEADEAKAAERELFGVNALATGKRIEPEPYSGAAAEVEQAILERNPGSW
ncbi:MAG: hypothetical protein Q9209_007644 [Squamulea sp. 1 TL-2023]